ncbi:MAG: type II toxin-antitoxin system PemK/MazF family toxin [Armatimonadota bacterium]
MSARASRGEIWWVDLAPTKGHEQSGRRPALIISADTFNHGPAGLVVVLPMTTTDRGIPLHVRIEPPEGGVEKPSVILCDQIRTISTTRLHTRLGSVSPDTIRKIHERLQILLCLS